MYECLPYWFCRTGRESLQTSVSLAEAAAPTRTWLMGCLKSVLALLCSLTVEVLVEDWSCCERCLLWWTCLQAAGSATWTPDPPMQVWRMASSNTALHLNATSWKLWTSQIGKHHLCLSMCLFSDADTFFFFFSKSNLALCKWVCRVWGFLFVFLLVCASAFTLTAFLLHVFLYTFFYINETLKSTLAIRM